MYVIPMRGATIWKQIEIDEIDPNLAPTQLIAE